MLLPDEARQRVLKSISTLGVESVAHAETLGRTLAGDIFSPLNLPPFDNSAMDGYALIAGDIEATSEQAPVELRLLGTVAAGEENPQVVTAGACQKIMTGAPLPAGADAVVMREATLGKGERVAFVESAQPGQHIRRAGSDIKVGERALRAGTLVRAAQWAMLAALGCAEVEVFRRPRVGILSTGNELVDVGEPVAGGQIRDSNSWALRGLTTAAGAEVIRADRVGDTFEAVQAALSDLARECDAIITSGGVSMGDFDPIRDVLQAQAQVHFWKVAMKPGKPLMFASWGQNTDKSVPIFALPGNPASAMVVFEEFVRPALLKMGGRRALLRPQVTARLVEPLHRVTGRQEFVRARVWWQDAGFAAKVTGDQGSGRLSTMTGANALLVIDAETSSLEAGATVDARLIEAPEVED